ncbi:MAG: glycosyltransferase family 2 protein, partial [Gemmatimonadetes bacterium]|nr:glycosyltransferase family 2 protein [Gemmatimonadota bacterium]
SVVIPAYRSERTIAETLRSILGQTRPAAEIIVVDDGSPDRSAEIAAGFAVRVVQQENAGPAAARNRGILEARGEWIAFADADDLWEPTKLERQWRAHELCPDAGVISCDFREFREQEIVIPSFFHWEHAHYFELERTPLAPGISHLRNFGDAFGRAAFFLFPSAVLARRDLLLEVGLFDAALRNFTEDLDLFYRLLARTSLVTVEEPLMAYRLHGNNSSRDEFRVLRGLVEVAEKARRDPAAYPPGAVARFARALPDDLAAIGRLLLAQGDHAGARRQLGRSLRLRVSSRALALWAVSWLSTGAVDRLVGFKRRVLGPRPDPAA